MLPQKNNKRKKNKIETIAFFQYYMYNRENLSGGKVYEIGIWRGFGWYYRENRQL